MLGTSRGLNRRPGEPARLEMGSLTEVSNIPTKVTGYVGKDLNRV